MSITSGLPGKRHHVYTYAAGFYEIYNTGGTCPCSGGVPPPTFVGSDYYCESGNPGPGFDLTTFYYSDVLWDRQQCGGSEVTCCNPPYLPWFCKNFSTPISEDLEVRICTDEDISNENVAIEFFELYILGKLHACRYMILYSCMCSYCIYCLGFHDVHVSMSVMLVCKHYTVLV